MYTDQTTHEKSLYYGGTKFIILRPLNAAFSQHNNILATPCRSLQEKWKDADDSIPNEDQAGFFAETLHGR